MRRALHTILLLTSCVAPILAQEVIPLPFSGDGTTAETTPEKQYFSRAWNTEVVSNVSKPSLTVYRPAAAVANGSAIVICPGGGFMALSINSEGIDVAKWMVEKGFTAFVLKYRLMHTGADATEEFIQLWGDKPKLAQALADVIPKSIADGLQAVSYVRKHAAEWNVVPEKVGIVGFSAGGTVTAGVALRYAPEGRPQFVAPIYAAVSRLKSLAVPNDAPPMFLAAATDDGLGLGPDSVALYQQWTGAQKSAELHMFSKGGHGFGMKKQGLPSDEWIERFWEWLQVQGFVKK